ncbi:MAG TPA: phosphotransferase, partial [Acidimicrobiia bacterium]|nr:phosphotransferase [Acidimicrobiia bacterium]
MAVDTSIGREELAAAVERATLDGHDGRSGASLERVRLADGRRLVVKRTSCRNDLTMRLLGDKTGRELDLWEAGVLDRLPSGVGHAVVGGWRDGDDVVVVMRDLGDAVITWDTPVGRAECRRIFAAAASLHAAFAGQSVDGLWALDRRLSLFAPRTLRTVPAGEEPLVDAALTGWERFAEVAPSDVVEAVAAVHDDPAPLAAALVSRGTTLVHGDLWLVNVAFDGDQVVLLDWNLAVAAPGAVDFATFLMGASGIAADREDLLDDIRQAQG